MPKIIRLTQIFATPPEFSQLERIEVGGRVYSVRESKKMLFAEINDGSALTTLQLIFDRELLSRLTLGSTVKVLGKLVLVPDRPHQIELKVHAVGWLSLAPADPAYFANHPLK